MRGLPLPRALVVALIACAVAAGVCAAPASATVFCKTNVETCSAENTYAVGSEFSFSTSGTSVVFETVAVKHKCKKATMGMKTESSEAGLLFGAVTNMTFGECSLEGSGFGECNSFEMRNLPWSARWSAGTGGGEDKMFLTESAKGRPAIRLLCFGFTCTYGSAELEIGMPVVSGKTHVRLERTLPLFESSPLCATTLKWSADYNSPSPEALFLTG